MNALREVYIPVASEPALPAGANLERVVDALDGLTVTLCAPDEAGTRLAVFFARRLALRVTDEGDRLRSMEVFDGRAETPLGVIENSRWVDWLVAESLDIRVHEALKHWCIVTPDDIVEVIAEDPPVVRLAAAVE